MHSDDTIRLLTSIDESLKRLVNYASATAAARAAKSNGSSATAGHEIASDKDLDSQYGDPEVRAKDPRDWTGPSMKGYRFSECKPEYLDLLAERFDYFAQKARDERDAKKEKYSRLDAARARGWARRIRNGWKPAEASGAFDSSAPDSSPFGAQGFDMQGDTYDQLGDDFGFDQ